MSNRAVEAYESGEKPISKWSKSDIIDEIVETSDLTDEQIGKLSRFGVKALKDVLLYKSSWHRNTIGRKWSIVQPISVIHMIAVICVAVAII